MSKDRLKQKLGERKSTRQMYADHRASQPVELESLRLDGGTQPRERFDEEVLSEYAERMSLDDRGFVIDEGGQEWEPIVVYEDGDDLWLADGFHRVRAARSRGITQFQARQIIGSQRDAVKFSLSANARHGLRRTNTDKRRAVERALQDQEWNQLSARALAELCAVSDFMVRQVREALVQRGELAESAQRLGADGKLHDVSTRQASSEEGSPVKAHTRRKRRLKLSEQEALSKTLDATTLTLDALDGAVRLTKTDCVVAYPQKLVHYDALRDHLPRLLKRQHTLIIPVSDGREGLLGPARLDPLVEADTLAAPRWIAIQDTQQIALVWSSRQDRLPSWSRTLDELIALVSPSSRAVILT